ncbi:MAG: hypothetical protein AAFV53_11060 [Myxococcota bacterium]
MCRFPVKANGVAWGGYMAATMATILKMPRWAPLLIAAAFLGAHNLRFQPWLLDDAYITLRYAENLAYGWGPVFNEGERVEGYTNFLWMILMAGGAWVGLDPVLLSQGLGIAFIAGVIVLLANSDRIVSGVSRPAAITAALIAGTSPLVSRWMMSGMETAMVTFWFVFAILLHLRDRARPMASVPAAALSGLICALAAMSRPDAGLLFGVLCLDRLFSLRQRDGGVSALLTVVAVFGAIFGGFFAWRWGYYGWPLPNTFYTKVGASGYQVLRGLGYVIQFLIVGWSIWLPTAVAAARPDLRPAGLGVAAGLVLLQSVYVVAVGGDAFYGHRFFAAFVPLMALVVAGVRQEVGGQRWPALLLWVPLLANLYWVTMSQQLSYPGRVSRRGVAVGAFLAEHTPYDAVLAVNVAGAIPYYSELKTIDMLGLCDEHIAHREIEAMGRSVAGHEKGDGDYVLSRRPDYVMFGSSLGQRGPKFLSDRELFKRDAFHQEYDLHVYAIPPDRRLRLWVRRPEAGGAGLTATPLEIDTRDRRGQFDTEVEDDGDYLRLGWWD